MSGPLTEAQWAGTRMKGLNNPFALIRLCWPHVVLYREQKEIIQSIWDNDETYVVAGNMLGKDFTAGLGVLTFFLTRHPVRIVTTSVDHTQLESVLWGEIRRFISSSRVPLDSTKGGPIIVNHLHLRKIVKGEVCGVTYCIGRTASKGEGMLGHHIADVGDGVPRTMFVADEASGVEDENYEKASTWFRRGLFIGNPYHCRNFFYKGIKGGSLRHQPHDLEGVI